MSISLIKRQPYICDCNKGKSRLIYEAKHQNEIFIHNVCPSETLKRLPATQHATDAKHWYLLTSTALSLTSSRQKEMLLKMAACSSAWWTNLGGHNKSSYYAFSEDSKSSVSHRRSEELNYRKLHTTATWCSQRHNRFGSGHHHTGWGGNARNRYHREHANVVNGNNHNGMMS